MMDPEHVISLLGQLRMLRFFPATPEVMTGLARLVGDMCADESQVEWLVNRMTSGIYREWPGPHEMRACLCHDFKPKDGINAYSTVYPDGLPTDHTLPKNRRIEAPELKALPPGHTVTTDPELDTLIVQAAAAKAIPTRPLPHTTRSAKFTRDLAELLTAPQDRDPLPGPTPQIITQADIDRAVAQHRAEKASAQQTLDF